MTSQKVRLSDICSFTTGKLNSNAAVKNGAYPFFTCAQETYRIDTPAFNTEAVLLGGNNANGIYPLKYYNGEFNAYQRTYVIEPLEGDALNIRFLYYALRPALARFQSASIGAATQYLTKSILDNFQITILERNAQDRAVEVLSAYDDLIENNKRRIELLEDAARQIYKEWFVRFRFPGHEHIKIVDGVPEGWMRANLFDVADMTYGYAFRSTQFNEEGLGLPVVRIRDVPNRWSKTFTEEEAPATKLLNDGDFLVGMDGDFHMNYWGGGRALINQRVVRVSGKSDVSTGYLKNAIEKPILDFNKTITGTTVRHLGDKHLRAIELLVPSAPLLNQSNEYFENIRKQVVHLFLQSRLAAEARDLLLPKLMSGEIAV